MLFLSSRARNTTVSGLGSNNRSYTHKVGHLCIVSGCLSIVTGLILIVIGVTSEVKTTTFIGVGIISLGVGFLLASVILFYAKLDIRYNNWAYRSRVIPSKIETPQPPSTDVRTTSPFVPSFATAEKRHPTLPLDRPTHLSVASDIEIHKVVITPPIKPDSKTIQSDDMP